MGFARAGRISHHLPREWPSIPRHIEPGRRLHLQRPRTYTDVSFISLHDARDPTPSERRTKPWSRRLKTECGHRVGHLVGAMYRSELHPEGTGGGSGGYSVQTELDAPAFAHAGERVRFFVTLLNKPPVTSCAPPCPDRSPAPLEWPQCPAYHQELEGATGSFSSNQLNCQPVNPMPPYAKAIFEMYIDVPADAQPGPSVLSFGFDDTRYQETSINLWIEP